MKRLTFACGATLDVRTWDTRERRVVVQTNPAQQHERPTPGKDYMEWAELKGDPEKYRTNCLLMCPLSERDSGRKVETGYFGETGDTRGRIVTCRIRSVADVEDPKEAA